MKILDSWVEPGNLHARRGVRLFHVETVVDGEKHESYYTGQELAKKIGKRWPSLYEQGRRKGFTDPSILEVGK